MVVPTQDDGSTVGSSAAKVGMLQDIAVAVYTWSLAIPEAIDSLDPGPGEQVHQLAAHHCSRAEFFIDRWLMYNIVRFEELAGTRQRQIVPRQWRAFIACDKGPCAESCPCVTTLLIQR